ncbi:hypothetical protein BDK92_7268 [Micromonospora pisi]|uniref:Major capsid protein E n=1 Tax=Micromonospora pisi TaxID=589240 RepID=A0A495JW30_9ACTN|nr:hypothetical protein [Micromonospora pisi]RKR92788.1 hypothetical protein BDK92_7268 [Micromonospora pisi]
MPGTYPAQPPTMVDNLITTHRLLQSPRQISRRLRTLAELRFVSDLILTGRLRSQGGAVLAEQSEPLRNARDARSIAPGAEYPRATPGVGTAILAAVRKWGQAVPITDEQIKRSVYGGEVVDRALLKTVNTVISMVDEITLSVVASQVTAVHEAIAPWDDDDAARMWRDVALAAAKIKGLNQGYVPDTLLMSDTKAALMMTDNIIAQLRRRETTTNPIYTGELDQVGPYRILTTTEQNLPTDDVLLFDSRQLGSMADETEVDPGYAQTDRGVQVKVIRIDKTDSHDIQARRLTVPIVQEPGAGIWITDTEGS